MSVWRWSWRPSRQQEPRQHGSNLLALSFPSVSTPAILQPHALHQCTGLAPLLLPLTFLSIGAPTDDSPRTAFIPFPASTPSATLAKQFAETVSNVEILKTLGERPTPVAAASVPAAEAKGGEAPSS